MIGSGLKLYREYLVQSVASRAHELDLDLILINNLRPTWQGEYFDEIHVVNVFDSVLLADSARQIARDRAVVAVLCWDEPLVMSAAELAVEFGVPGLSIAGVHGCRDKHSARTRLTDAGLLQPLFAMTATVREALDAAERIGYPVVVKPRALGASMGVVLAETEDQLIDAFHVASNASLIGDKSYHGGAIVEEYAVGPEISIDAAVHNGRYIPLFIARKSTGEHPYFEETGHIVDAGDVLMDDPALLQTLREAHTTLGIENGITHSEVRLTARGPLIIEINGRVGGDLIPFLGKIATGIDPGVVLVDVALGHTPDVARTTTGVAGIRFNYPDHDCLVDSVTVPTDTPGLVTAAAMVGSGTTLRLPPGGYIARHSFVVCQGSEPDIVERRLEVASNQVELLAHPVDIKPSGSMLEMPAGLLDADA